MFLFCILNFARHISILGSLLGRQSGFLMADKSSVWTVSRLLLVTLLSLSACQDYRTYFSVNRVPSRSSISENRSSITETKHFQTSWSPSDLRRARYPVRRSSQSLNRYPDVCTHTLRHSRRVPPVRLRLREQKPPSHRFRQGNGQTP
jgi:hypothetical protein